MIVSTKYLKRVYDLQEAAKAGQHALVIGIEGELWESLKPIFSLPENLQPEAEVMEIVGLVARVLRDTKQFCLAARWFEQLCRLALQLDPDSEDTGWDHCLLSECYVETGQRVKAEDALGKARRIAATVNCQDDALERAVRHLEARLT